jgi:hypothetical protein
VGRAASLPVARDLSLRAKQRQAGSLPHDLSLRIAGQAQAERL